MSSPHIVDATDGNFQQEVLDFSMHTPVVIDFWAEWCQPCKTIGPMLEEISEEYEGAFRLAKVDVDQNQQLAMAAQVQSIPTLMVAYNGTIVDKAVGAMPRTGLQDWIAKNLNRFGIEKPQKEEAPTDELAAVDYWEGKLEQEPEDSEALLELSRLLVDKGKLEDAKPYLERIKVDAQEYSAAQAIIAVLQLLEEVAEAGGDEAVRAQLAADPDNTRTRYLVACSEAGKGDFVGSLKVLIDLVAKAKGDDRDAAKKGASIVFAAAGRGSSEIEDMRRQLARLLY